MSEFKRYRRTNIAEMRPYVKGEDLTGISVSEQDDPETDMGMIARNLRPEKKRKALTPAPEQVGLGLEFSRSFAKRKGRLFGCCRAFLMAHTR